MSTWRRKAIEAFPSLRRDIENPEKTVMQLFFDLLPMARDAHAADDRRLVTAIYDFAAWCARQDDKALWNAAGVGFYEHLVEHDVTLKAIPDTVPPDVFADVHSLFADRMTKEALQDLLKAYDKRHRTSFAKPR